MICTGILMICILISINIPYINENKIKQYKVEMYHNYKLAIEFNCYFTASMEFYDSREVWVR